MNSKLKPKTTTSNDIFISYHWENLIDAIKLHNSLVAMGYRVWLDLVELRFGDIMRSKMEDAIRNSALFICIFGESYAASSNCEREITLAIRERKTIYTMLLHKNVIKSSLYVNAAKNSQKVFEVSSIDNFFEELCSAHLPEDNEHQKLTHFSRRYNFLPTVQAYRA